MSLSHYSWNERVDEASSVFSAAGWNVRCVCGDGVRQQCYQYCVIDLDQHESLQFAAAGQPHVM